MWEITRAKLENARKEQGITYVSIADHVGYSDSTIHRWLADPKEQDGAPNQKKKCAPPYDTIVDMAEYLNVDIRDITAAVGAKEMQVAQDINYMGTKDLLAEMQRWKQEHSHHCQIVIDHHAEIRALDAAHHAEMTGRLTAEVSYLKEQVRRFRLTSIILLALYILSIIAIFVILFVDIPQIGAGGSILK